MISPEIKKIRMKLDKLDNKLLLIVKKRTALVNRVIKLKKNRKEIVDKKRINSILKRIKSKSIKLKIDPAITNSICPIYPRSNLKGRWKGQAIFNLVSGVRETACR